MGSVPVFFRAGPELPAAAATLPAAAASADRWVAIFFVTLVGSVLAAALWLARRNLTGARADRRGAARIAAVILAVELAAWMVSASHAPVYAEFELFFGALAWALLSAGIVWVLYIALEPLLRRRAPASLISWTRLLAGRARDPLVGRDLLFGSLLGAAGVVVAGLVSVWRWKTGLDPVPVPEGVYSLIGVPGLFQVAGVGIRNAFAGAMAFLLLFSCSRGLCARALAAPSRSGP